jgi:hypothetical protein
MNKLLSLFLISLIVVFIQACTQDRDAIYPTTKNYIMQPSNKKIVLLHPYSYQQTTRYTCGVAVVMTLMHFYGKLSTAQMNKSTEMRIAREMGVTSSGGSQLAMVTWLEKNGFNVHYGQNASTSMLVDNLNNRIPTIIAWNDWTGHSILVIGYAEDENHSGDNIMFIADPSTSSTIVRNHESIRGINTLAEHDLKLNWFNSQYFFNPSHTASGMYVVAVPKR